MKLTTSGLNLINPVNTLEGTGQDFRIDHRIILLIPNSKTIFGQHASEKVKSDNSQTKQIFNHFY